MRPPVTGEGEGEGDPDRVVVDLPSFLQDRPAIGGKWYDYNVDGHILEPKDEAWILVSAAGEVSAFEIVSVYDDDTGDSGRFTLNVAQQDRDDETTWTAPQTFVSSVNVKDGPSCVQLAGLLEGSCDDAASRAGFDLRLTLQTRLSVFAGFAVAEPAVFLAPGARVARVDGTALEDLPSPASLVDLVDSDASYDSTEWDYAALAPDLPRRGQVFGDLDRVVGDGDEFWVVVDGNRGLVEFSVARVDDATLRFTLRRQQIAIDDGSVPKDLGEFRDVDVDIGAPPVFLSFTNDDLLSLPADLDGASWPNHPPFSRDYDVVVVDDEGGPRLLLSPASAALHESAE